MGLFSKLLGGAKDISLEKVLKTVTEAADKLSQNSGDNSFSESHAEDIPDSGFSWGEKMPAEENQYNFSGNYVKYFNHVFTEDFPGYDISYEQPPKSSSTVFTFRQASRRVLVVSADMKDIRFPAGLRAIARAGAGVNNIPLDRCAEEGIPYLRFYYNHHGWWNTRAYVDHRTRSALMG